uniref:DNA polymerase delta subunit 3 n=1 Tax=Anthurium amnicola TaxID=1678845 RepID=A0A1D1Z457_9ARAE
MPSHTSLCLLLAVALCAVAVVVADDAPGGDAGGGHACMGVDVGDDGGDQRPRLKNECSACSAIADCCKLLKKVYKNEQCSGVQKELQHCPKNSIGTILRTCGLCIGSTPLCSSASDVE